MTVVKNTFYANPDNGMNNGDVTIGVPKTEDAVDKEASFSVSGGGNN